MAEVKGLAQFAEHFKDWQEHYVLIGGVASSISMEEAGLEFRTTKDLDIVLVIEVLSSEFVVHFWDFINRGDYEIRERDNQKPNCYRFTKPANADYPAQVELFSRMPGQLTLDEDAILTPIPVEEDVSSLSAILLDDHYYTFLLAGRHISEEDGLAFIHADRLIPFKAKAWLDLSNRKEMGDKLDSKNINKHRNDVLKLSGLLSGGPVVLPAPIFEDLSKFIDGLEHTEIDLKTLNIHGSLDDIVIRLREGFISKGE